MPFENAESDETLSTCPYCGVGCGVLVKPSSDAQTAEVRGDPDHPANFGRLCSKGAALGETLTHDERLLYPEVLGERESWDNALDLVADRFRETVAMHGPDSVAFYVSGQLLTEDYYVANKLMKGFIGSGNIDTNSRLCMASSVAGYKRAFGSDTVPGCYEDLEEADLIVMVGSNLAWCHPVLHQRILAAKKKRGLRLVVIDPRKTATTEAADLHLAISPGADGELFSALFAHLAASTAADNDFVEAHTEGLKDALAEVRSRDMLSLAEVTGLSVQDLLTFFEWVRSTEKHVTVFSQGVNQSSFGTDDVNAIINCHLVTGRIGRPGMGPFSITGQPNAMGGREVGGLANQLAAHMDFASEDVDRVRRFWGAPCLTKSPGQKAVELFEDVRSGRIKALWVIATNPAVSMPNADRVRDAIAKCDFVVVSDVVSTSDTLKLGHVRLPATAWGEKTGTVTNSERRISRQRSFLKPPGGTRHDWDIIADVARRMGYSGFDYSSAADVFREYARLTAFENNGSRDLDLGGLSDVSDEGYDALAPFQWPLPAAGALSAGRTDKGQHRFFADGRFYTPSGKARFIATPDSDPQNLPSDEYPFVLNTGRIRDQWHTMTRTAKSERLTRHISEPFLEINPADAERLELDEAGLAHVKSKWGEVILRVLVTTRVQPGQVFAPMHWTARYASRGRVDALTSSARDPVSGQPELKFTPVSIAPAKMDWYGFGVFEKEPDEHELAGVAYWSKARAENGWRVEFAGKGEAGLVSELTGGLIARETDGSDLLTLDDASKGLIRRAAFVEDRLIGAMLVSMNGPVAADRSWLGNEVGKIQTAAKRLNILAGRAPVGAEAGRTICSCMGVGLNAILACISKGATTVDAIGEITTAGTNCGSCKPEIGVVLDEVLASQAQLETAAE